MLFLFIFAASYLGVGLCLAVFLARFHRSDKPEEVLLLCVHGFGLGPVVISLILCLDLLLFPGLRGVWCTSSVTVIFLGMLLLGRREFARCAAAAKQVVSRLLADRGGLLLYALILLALCHVFIQAIGFPFATNDACAYGFYGKYLYAHRSLDTYPLTQPEPSSGAVLKLEHGPGLPLIYSWFYLLQRGTHSDLIARTVSAMYALYTLLYLFLALLRDRGRIAATFGALVLIGTPIWIRQGCDNSIDSLRIYLFTSCLFCLASFASRRTPLLGILTVVTCGLACYVHFGSLLLLPVAAGALLITWPTSWRWKLCVGLAGVVAGTAICWLLIGLLSKEHGSGRALAHFSLQSPEPTRSQRLAVFGSKWTEKVESGEVGALKTVFREKLQFLSRPSLFGVTYYLFLLGSVGWFFRRKRAVAERVLFVSVLLASIPILHRYYLNFRYISTLNP